MEWFCCCREDEKTEVLCWTNISISALTQSSRFRCVTPHMHTISDCKRVCATIVSKMPYDKAEQVECGMVLLLSRRRKDRSSMLDEYFYFCVDTIITL
jgi:hypothetical protein